ncbi:thioredoxin [Oxynema sp. CENA135]|jgi:thioredoxin 1|uniref:Thioredoxin n=1 Tax=Oxynema aestuarii AP17 TaxID=2064643 RepID=A0A6H1TXY6_9CYAN|nr:MULTISPECIES: thioredoxin family protein [Oxynema]MBK4730054.1 thioredoxin [Oxynema sp. CENA135]QIZ71462.1 thioredoxin [Oxynema aestuarii AP17]RMH78200.1 MAG: thioredoxin [Cyanobacteria bacterium J007]
MSSVITITDSQFETEVERATQPVLVYFWASWCGPCRLVSPSIDAIAGEYGDRLKVVKLEVDPNPESVAKCQVEGVPALRLYDGNQLLYSHEGAITKAKLADALQAKL